MGEPPKEAETKYTFLQLLGCRRQCYGCEEIYHFPEPVCSQCGDPTVPVYYPKVRIVNERAAGFPFGTVFRYGGIRWTTDKRDGTTTEIARQHILLRDYDCADYLKDDDIHMWPLKY